MKQEKFAAKLTIIFLKERKRFIAYAPALDLSTSGKTLQEAKKQFAEIAQIFFEELIEKNTVREVLEDLGWEKKMNEWHPPVVLSPGTFSIPVAV